MTIIKEMNKGEESRGGMKEERKRERGEKREQEEKN